MKLSIKYQRREYHDATNTLLHETKTIQKFDWMKFTLTKYSYEKRFTYIT